MKKYLIFCVASAIALAGCSKEQEQPASGTDGVGRVEFACVSNASVDELTRAVVDLPASCKPSDNLFKLELVSEDGTYRKVYDPFSTYDRPFLTAGNYTATVSYGDPEGEGETAFCYGGSTPFTVVARRTTNETVTARLINSAVKLSTTEWFDKYYTGATFTLTTGSGNSFDFTPGEGKMIFVKAGTALSLKGAATKSQNGVAVTFPERTIGTTAATSLYTIRVDASQAGEGTLTITFDDSMISVEPVDIELNPQI